MNRAGGRPMMMESPKKAGVAELKLPTVSELATSVAEANAALSYQLKRIANLEAELRTSNAERDAATGARSQEFLLMQTSISDLEMQLVQLDRERDAARVELERVNSHRTRTEEAALAAGEAALAIKAEQQRAAAERETALAQVARERELAQQMVEASKLEVDAVKRAAQAEKAAALEAAAAKSVLDLEDARRRVASEKQVAFEEASAELMAAVGNLLQQAGERGAAPAGAPGATRTLGELRSGFAPSLRSGRGGTSVSSADGPRSDVTDDESDEDAAINPDRIPERGMARPPAAAPITEAKVKARVARARRSRSRVEAEAAATAAAEHRARSEAEAKLRAECEHYQRLALTAEGRAKTAEAKAAKAEARLASVEAAKAATAEAEATTTALALTADQSPADPNEKARLESAGHHVQDKSDVGDPARVFLDSSMSGGGLAVPRTLGDHAFSSAGLVAEPVISTHTLSKETDNFLLLASDGVWDVMQTDELVPFLAPTVAEGAMPACEALCNEAVKRWASSKDYQDDISVVCVRFDANVFTS
mmetsp:Transcript_36809/g.96842  ORF Transcript_36809/g.96842 Transcript_36809/m.96842 type:complete len:540 (+) Transcript_36809:85-1704(+)